MKKLLTFILLLIFSCKNYYNEMIHWTTNIPMGTSIDSVKKIQPTFIEIDWNKPDTIDWIKSDTSDNALRYFITNIKYDYDILQMSNYLVFVDGKYQGRFAHK